MFRFVNRLAMKILAAILIAATPTTSAIEAIAHARSADQPHHPDSSHFEDQQARSHSDHCFAGRTLGLDRFVCSGEPAKVSAADDVLITPVANDRAAAHRPLYRYLSRAPPPPVVRA